MKKVLFSLFLLFTAIQFSTAQTPKVFTQDIDNFWVAYDSVRTTRDSAKQVNFIKTLYIDKGTEGLKAFMEVRDYTAEKWADLIRRFPKFWDSVRPGTLTIKSKADGLETGIGKLKRLYPELKEAKIYFTIGGLNSGGTTSGNLVLIGSEIATGNDATDVSEFKNGWLAGIFKGQTGIDIVPINIHEYVHTQQKGESTNLLAQAIKEGSCDFIAELAVGASLQKVNFNYGTQHEKELKQKFKEEMFSTSFNYWLYNGSGAAGAADLGYFMGYVICKSYYNQAKDKKKAIKDIIELDYSDTLAVDNFLIRSGYYTEPPDKQGLIRAFTEKLPVISRMLPFSNGDSLVDPGISEITFAFSKPMNPDGYSIEYGEKGKEHFPITGLKGFAEDHLSFTVKTTLKPSYEYEFVITDRSFKSKDGYPLVNYPVKFKTRP